MDNTLKNLKTAIFSVIEQMFFMIPDGDEVEPSSSIDEYSTFIGIIGDPAYLISFVIDSELATSMTSELLGMDSSELDEDIVQKSMSETANVIAGNFLLCFDGEENRNVTLPSDIKDDVFSGGSIGDRIELHLSYNSKPFTAVLESVTT